jgi:hypothetical protein
MRVRLGELGVALSAAVSFAACSGGLGQSSRQAQVYRWSVTDEANAQVVSAGCTETKGLSEAVQFPASAGQRVADRVTSETVVKSQDAPIPQFDDNYWCGTDGDAKRETIRGTAPEGCATTDADSPATLDSVDLIEPMSSGILTISKGYVLHLTVVHPGVFWLVYNSPPCWAPGRRDELTVLTP